MNKVLIQENNEARNALALRIGAVTTFKPFERFGASIGCNVTLPSNAPALRMDAGITLES